MRPARRRSSETSSEKPNLGYLYLLLRLSGKAKRKEQSAKRKENKSKHTADL